MSATTRPILPPIPEASQFPRELLTLPNWCGWRGVWNESKQKFEKIPCSALTGEAAGWMESGQPFDEARDGAIKNHLDGLSVIFNGDGRIGIDFDHCIHDGVIHPEVDLWLKNWFSGTYAEASVSGSGIHVLARGHLAKALTPTALPGADGVTVEAYSRGRHFATTGQRIGDSAVVSDCQLAVSKLLAFVGEPQKSPPRNASNSAEQPKTPAEIRSILTKKLDELRSAPQGAGNSILNSTAWFAARALASGALKVETEKTLKGDILHIVCDEWSKPHPRSGALATIDSGWNSGLLAGGFALKKLPITSLSAYLADAPEELPYIVNGLLYRQAAHQLMGTIKAGKTTFVLMAIKAILSGEKFLGQPCEPTNILYVSEQPRFSFQSQLRDTRVAEPQGNLCKPRAASLYILDLKDLGMLNWQARAQLIREVAQETNAGLVVIDTFIRIACIEEVASAGEANAAFERISPLVVNDGRGLLLCWHERKIGGSIVEASQGSVAHGGAVDMLIRLSRPTGERFGTHNRRLETLGRIWTAFEEPAAIAINETKTDYKLLGPAGKAQRATAEQKIMSILPRDVPGLNQSEILDALNELAEREGYKAPSRTTAQRAIEKLVEDGLAIFTPGTKGGKNEGVGRYRAPGQPF